MFNFSTQLRHAVLGLALAAASLCAHADVIPGFYHVTLNTGAAAGSGGYLDFQFTGAGTTTALATISNLQGAVTGIDASMDKGTVTGLGPGSFSMVNDGAYLSHFVDLGGIFSFDVAFSGDLLNTIGLEASSFTVAAYGADLAGIGDLAYALQIELFQPNGVDPLNMVVSADAALAAVTAVPEPSELLLVLTGLALIGWTAGRRVPK